jgi:hypothetical protein
LQRAYRELGRLYDDVYPSVASRQDWTGKVFARRSLGDEVPVEAWSLAEHFLLSWNHWHGLSQRFTRYFGQSEDRFPKSWQRRAREGAELARRLLRNSQLDQLIAEVWLTPPAMTRLVDEDHTSARSIYHSIVANHERMLLFADEQGGDEVEPRELISEPTDSKGEKWPRCQTITQRLNELLMDAWNELPRKTRDDVLWHLRQYRHANLFVSWLNGNGALPQSRSALSRTTRWDKVMNQTFGSLVDRLDVDDAERQTIHRVLDRILTAVSEVGYEHFIDDVTSGDLQLGPDTPIGSDTINLIPSDTKGPCCTTLIAVSKGEKRATGFPTIMQQVREHLIRCYQKTRVVIFFCDVWRPDILDAHIGDLRAHHDRGVRFVFLLAGTPARSIAPIAVDLGASP